MIGEKLELFRTKPIFEQNQFESYKANVLASNAFEAKLMSVYDLNWFCSKFGLVRNSSFSPIHHKLTQDLQENVRKRHLEALVEDALVIRT